jgi:phage tail-like protein
MERGVTHDPEFEAWANKVWNFGNAQAPADQREKEVSLKDFRRNLTIDVFNEAGQKVISYKVYRAWVSEFTAQTDLDANANAILIQSIKIEHEGWERDTAVKEPSEPQFEDAGV